MFSHPTQVGCFLNFSVPEDPARDTPGTFNPPANKLPRNSPMMGELRGSLFAGGLKKAKTEGKQCHAKTMKSKRSW